MVSFKSLIIVGYILFIRDKTEKGAKNKHTGSALDDFLLWLGRKRRSFAESRIVISNLRKISGDA